MSKRVLIATDKPFAAEAVKGIRSVIEKAGYELVLLEKYTEKQQLLDAVSDVDARLSAVISLIRMFCRQQSN